MKILFDSKSENSPADGTSLLLEAGKDYCAYGVWQRSANAFHALRYISFSEAEGPMEWPGILAGIDTQKFEQVFISPAFVEALLYPAAYFKNDYEAVDIIYGKPGQAYLHDNIPEWRMVNMYVMPLALHDLLQQKFASPQFVHAYTPAIKVYNGYTAENQLSVHFVPEHFRVLLKKDATVQLAQTYRYQTPLDVVYFLLKICYEFSLEQSSVHLILSGLIEKDSSLFTEIEQYFTNVHFAHPPEMRLPGSEHPHYYFTSLYNLAQCVS